jgi:hypothetical protein
MISYPRWRHKYKLKSDVWIFEPTEETIRIGNEIKNAVQEKWSIPYNYYHLNLGGHVAALNLHKSDTTFVHLDISKFFNTINKSRITRSLKTLFDYPTSRKYALLSTVKLPDKSPTIFILPYGFVQSPILASLCLRQSTLGIKIENLSKSSRVRISVYMDDIVISGNDSSFLQTVVSEMKSAADRSGFFLNPEKEEGPAPEITAFNIKLTNSDTVITCERYEELWRNYNGTSNKHVKRGIATYVSTVNSSQLSGLDRPL